MKPDNFSDIYIKNIVDDGSIDSGLIYFTRPYDFSLSGNYSSTSVNVFNHVFDQTIYPSTLISATGFSVYASSSNSFSGYYYVSMMKLFNLNEIKHFNGLFATTTLTSSITSSFNNSSRFNPDVSEGDRTIYQTLSSSISAIHLFAFDRNTYGDKIYDGSLSLYMDNVCIAYDSKTIKDTGIYTLTSSLSAYQSTTSSTTKFWVLPDTGLIMLWSSDSSVMNGLTGVNRVVFRNGLGIANTTINIHIDPDEYNLSENYSFYEKDYHSGQLPDTWITTIGLYNPWNDLLAVCKLQRPIRKTRIPLTFKIVIDHL